MSASTYRASMFGLGLAGVLFSGYLSAVKLFSGTCALSEPCPYFLGYPACWYGFAMFSVIFYAGLMGFMKKMPLEKMVRIETTVSALGILFASYFTIPEIKYLVAGTSSYSLGLPTCAYGLIFYVLIFIFSLLQLKTKE